MLDACKLDTFPVSFASKVDYSGARVQLAEYGIQIRNRIAGDYADPRGFKTNVHLFQPLAQGQYSRGGV